MHVNVCINMKCVFTITELVTLKDTFIKCEMCYLLFISPPHVLRNNVTPAGAGGCFLMGAR